MEYTIKGDNMEMYKTGQFAKLAKVSERTVRYYDEQGLCKPSLIMENGYRYYRKEDVALLHKITTLKYLGFSLAEIKVMLKEENQEAMHSSLHLKIGLLEQKIQHMQAMKEALESGKDILVDNKMNWEELSDVIQIKEQDQKIKEHYRSSNHLSIRIRLHDMYSVNKQGWFPWLYEQIDFAHVYRLLEVGCGNGSLWQGKTLHHRNREIFLSDISQGMVDTVRSLLQDSFSYMCFDCEKIPFKKDYFDAVVANHMLFYVKDIHAGLKEIARVLKRGGILYCSAYGQDHLKEITAFVQRFDANIYLSKHRLYDKFGIENGASMLKPYFSSIEFRAYKDALEVTEVEPLFEYIMSCHGNQNEVLKDREDEFKDFLREEIEKHGSFHVSKHAGLFICKK